MFLRSPLVFAAFLIALLVAGPYAAGARQINWKGNWPATDIAKRSVSLSEFRSGGPARDGIPPIDNPRFAAAKRIVSLGGTAPVISVILNGEAKAYPLQVLLWHEIVNDTVGGVPVTVTFCPLCNTSMVFDRRLDGRVFDFGTSGMLRNSDLVMYDRQTESLWQQFLGEALVSEMTGAVLKLIPARVESFGQFRARAPEGKVLIPNNQMARPYGSTPYKGYDSSLRPFLYRGKMPPKIAPLARVVRVGSQAWSLELVQKRKRLKTGDGLVIAWSTGQNSVMDEQVIANGADIGNVTVQRDDGTGLRDVPYSVDFAFAFHAFYPDGIIHLD